MYQFLYLTSMSDHKSNAWGIPRDNHYIYKNIKKSRESAIWSFEGVMW
jgi:hypothetical protein